tara:strand:- start:768 stop:1127 length:360 start_codon:yes stop_codon:yes gene_type:complete
MSTQNTQDIRIEQRGDLAVLAVDKPMLTSLEADRLLTTLRSYHEQTGCVQFVIDMAGVDFIDSACIGSMVTFLIEIDKANGKLMLAGCQKTVEELLKITGLTTHIPLVASVEHIYEDRE